MQPAENVWIITASKGFCKYFYRCLWLPTLNTWWSIVSKQKVGK